MRKMVQTAEMDRDNAVQRSAMLTQQISQQATADIKGQIGKLTGLEREHMKLTASQSLAEVSLFFFVCIFLCQQNAGKII